MSRKTTAKVEIYQFFGINKGPSLPEPPCAKPILATLHVEAHILLYVDAWDFNQGLPEGGGGVLVPVFPLRKTTNVPMSPLKNNKNVPFFP